MSQTNTNEYQECRSYGEDILDRRLGRGAVRAAEEVVG